MSQKLTTRDLIGTLIDLEEDMLYEESEEQQTMIQEGITKVKKEISRKVEGIDYFALEMSRQSSLIDAEIKTMTDEVKRLRMKKNAIKRTEDYFNKVLLPMIIETAGNEGVFKTDTAKYKLYETWGPIEVDDEEMVPDEYKRAKIMINLKLLRSNTIIPSGFWLQVLWLFGIGIKNGNDNHGSFVMLSLAIWRLQTHFTISLDTK